MKDRMDNTNTNTNTKNDEILTREDREMFSKINSFMDLSNKIKSWVDNTSIIDFHNEIKEVIKGQDGLINVIMLIHDYMTGIANDEIIKNNILIAAPSGCGKTATFRALRDYFSRLDIDIPICQVDMSNITEEGYKGADTVSIVEGLTVHEGAYGGVGIVFLDEFDKKLIPSIGSGIDVNKAVQSQILTLIEGRVMRAYGVTIDTNNTLFIAMGSFDSCRKTKKVEKHMGFGTELADEINHYEDITREDMIRMGAIEELLGRFTMIINYHELSDESLDEIIKHYVIKCMNSMRVGITKANLYDREIKKKANGPYGCRIIKNLIYEDITNIRIELLTNPKEERWVTRPNNMVAYMNKEGTLGILMTEEEAKKYRK
ncbi:MAG: AAA family ATPase [Butyrivibrio sp.]|nr:AAA family ATPase [Butyrivibrio sp.]